MFLTEFGFISLNCEKGSKFSVIRARFMKWNLILSFLNEPKSKIHYEQEKLIHFRWIFFIQHVFGSNIYEIAPFHMEFALNFCLGLNKPNKLFLNIV